MASQLARHGVSCRLVDEAVEPSGNSRAVVVQARTLEPFGNMGVVAEALASGVLVHGLSMYVAGRRAAHVVFDELDSPYPYSLDLAQAETERILRQYLATFRVAVECGTQLTGFTQDAAGVTATLRHSGWPRGECAGGLDRRLRRRAQRRAACPEPVL
jgi:2-polyprenyl-6-methoxyphenol hydroxylase-like FAD-dependent oxidoreductase